MISAGVDYRTPCPFCDAQADCHAGQSLYRASIEWSFEYDCAACGCALADCGGGRADTPEDLRQRLLAAQPPLRLDLPVPADVAVMRVLRAEYGFDLARARTALAEVKDGTFPATGPELALLAVRLGELGVTAQVTGPSGGPA
ncbi:MULTISPECIES: hypothetical protein [Kitasatospora]|uniref:Ribosomal protein S27E n=2 Tax=Kitasatospora TaxID=2063 RepID=A0ABT1J3C1_9ACTN|nr:hypothetical protein [Kitasatospora paracochleata]MCP2311922.1 ribosomal protein S27E [Kitasatospora paracochleata]